MSKIIQWININWKYTITFKATLLGISKILVLGSTETKNYSSVYSYGWTKGKGKFKLGLVQNITSRLSLKLTHRNLHFTWGFYVFRHLPK